MNTNFMCEKLLAQKNPHYHELVKNTAFVIYHSLEKYKQYFPDYTDHTILHSLQVIDFCNRIIGEYAPKLNEDELYVLFMSAYLHDSGMGITQNDYKELYEYVVSDEYKLSHPIDNIPETIRSFHQSFSKNFILKYADLFEIPSEEHINAIALVSEAHRETDLFDENILPSVIKAPNGNEIHLPYLASLIRLADEMDIASDRNIEIYINGRDNIYKQMHRAIKHLEVLDDHFLLDVSCDDPALYDDIYKEIKKLEDTLVLCCDVVSKRTPFKIKQNKVVINRVHKKENHIIILDSDFGTDDACAMLALKNLDYKPDYIVTSFGNTTPQNTVKNAVLLKKYLGLTSKIVQGQPVPKDPALPLEEKNDFHGTDGLAGCANALADKINLNITDFSEVYSFDTFVEEIKNADSITYSQEELFVFTMTQ